MRERGKGWEGGREGEREEGVESSGGDTSERESIMK